VIEAVIPNLDAFRQGMQQQLLIVPSQTAIASAIAQMRQIPTSCVLVVDQTQLVGIFTESEAVRAIAADVPLDTTPLADWLSPPQTTLSESELGHSFTVLRRFCQSTQQHVPVYNQQGQAIGVITPHALQQALAPQALLQHRQVGEVMTTQVGYVTPTTPVAQLIQLMVEHSLKAVVIGNSGDLIQCSGRVLPEPPAIFMPIGLVTEQEIIQTQLAGLDIKKTLAQAVMQSLPSVQPCASLWAAHQQMQRQAHLWLAVTDATGALVGVVTQANVLQTLDPAEMYRLIATWQAAIAPAPVSAVPLTLQTPPALQTVQQKFSTEEAQETSLTFLSNSQSGLQEGAEIFRQIAENIPQFFFVKSVDLGQFLYVSPAYEKIWGLTCESLYRDAKSWLATVYPDDLPGLLASLAEQEQGKTVRREYRIIRPNDGSIHWIVADIIPIFDSAGQLVRYVGIADDITDRKQLEIALQHSQAKLYDVLDSVLAAIVNAHVFADRTWQYNYLSPGCEDVFGYTVAEWMADPLLWWSRILPEDIAAVIEPSFEAIFAERKTQMEYRFTHKDGTLHWIAASMTSRWDDTANAWIVTQAHLDISDRKQAEAALQSSEQRLQAILNSAPFSIFIKDLEGRYLLVNPAYETLINQCRENLLGRTDFDLLPPETSERCWTTDQVALTVNHAITFEEVIPVADSLRTLLVSKFALYNAANQLYAICGIAVDMTDRKELENELHTSKTILNDILDSAVAAVVRARVYADGTFEYDFISSGCEAVFGYTAQEFMADKKLWQSRLYLEDAEAHALNWLERILEQETFKMEYRFLHKDGSLRWISTAYAARRHIVSNCWVVTIVDHDITERRQAEEQLRRNEAKLREAQRVAHLGNWEFNVITHKLLWSEEVFHICGFDPTQPEPTLAQFLRRCHPADWALIQTRLRQTAQVDDIFSTHFRIIRQDGSIRYLATKGEREFDIVGNIIRLFGIVQDITDRKQAEEALQQQADRERLLGKISQRIRQSLELHEILKITVSEVRHLLQTDRVLIYRIEPNLSGTVVEESVASGWMPLLHRNIIDFCLAENYIQQYRQGLVTVKSDIYNSSTQPCHIEFLEKFQVKANLVIPIFQRETLWGLLIVHQCSTVRHWQTWEIALLQQLATQVGIALQQSELYQQVRRLNLTLENQVQERTADLQRALNFEALLKRITDKVRDSLDERQILQTAVAELANGLFVNCCNAALYDLEQNTTTICYEHLRSSDFVSLTGVTVSLEPLAGLYQQLLQGKAIQFCLLYPVSTSHLSTNYRLVTLGCPIVDDQGVLGDLWLFKPKLANFNDQEVRLVQQVANQCAIALRQSRLYQASQAQVQELERLNRLKDDFLSTVPHELRTPVTNIKMATQMLEIGLKRLGVLNDTATPVNRYFQILKDECQREINLINDLLDLTRLDAEATPLTLTPINLTTLISRIAEPFSERTQNQQQHLILHLPAQLPPMTTDLSSMERILSELLQNACKYTPSGENITLFAQVLEKEELDQPGGTVLISICNTGVEISPVEQDRIFDKFYRIPNNDPWQHGGTGLGLALVKKLVDRLSGSIHLESQAKQVTFKVLLPLNVPNG
jgi:PAS domain S-box-containing protein